MYFPLTIYSSCQTSEDAHEYMAGLRQCLLDELQLLSQGSDVTEKNVMYDEHLHSSMVKCWDLFKGMFTQYVTCTQCNNTTTIPIRFSKLMSNFLEEHHTRDRDCTLKDIIHHQYWPNKINDYQCDACTRLTFAVQHTVISQFPKILCIVLGQKKPDGTIIN